MSIATTVLRTVTTFESTDEAVFVTTFWTPADVVLEP